MTTVDAELERRLAEAEELVQAHTAVCETHVTELMQHNADPTAKRLWDVPQRQWTRAERAHINAWLREGKRLIRVGDRHFAVGERLKRALLQLADQSGQLLEGQHRLELLLAALERTTVTPP